MKRLQLTLVAALLLSSCAPARGPGRSRAIADGAAVTALAQQEAHLRARQRQVILRLEDYDVKVSALEQDGEAGWHFLYIHRRPSIGLGPGEGHFSIWVSRQSRRAVYRPGR